MKAAAACGLQARGSRWARGDSVGQKHRLDALTPDTARNPPNKAPPLWCVVTFRHNRLHKVRTILASTARNNVWWCPRAVTGSPHGDADFCPRRRDLCSCPPTATLRGATRPAAPARRAPRRARAQARKRPVGRQDDPTGSHSTGTTSSPGLALCSGPRISPLLLCLWEPGSAGPGVSRIPSGILWALSLPLERTVLPASCWSWENRDERPLRSGYASALPSQSTKTPTPSRPLSPHVPLPHECEAKSVQTVWERPSAKRPARDRGHLSQRDTCTPCVQTRGVMCFAFIMRISGGPWRSSAPEPPIHPSVCPSESLCCLSYAGRQ